MLKLSFKALKKRDLSKVDKIYELEERTDMYEDVLGSYLVKLSGKNLSKKDSQSMSVMLHCISDFERIADHAINIVESASEMNEKDYKFSKNAKAEIEILLNAVQEIVENTVNVFNEEDIKGAVHIEPLEEVIDGLTKKIKQHHIKRLRKGKCTIELGLILEDILTNVERISDHSVNIATQVITSHQAMNESLSL